MNLFLLQALAVGLTISQIITQPDVKTSFSPTQDRAEVRRILFEGCTQLRGILGKVNPALGKMDPSVFLGAQLEAARKKGQDPMLFPDKGLKVSEAKDAYDIFCTNVEVAGGDKILDEVIGYYNISMYDLPDVTKLTGGVLKEYSTVTDAKGNFLTDMYRSSRRKILTLEQIPDIVKKAFLAAEDQDFFEHNGVDPKGVVNAGLRNLMKTPGGREQGGSTITQQLIKNLLLTGDVTYERKMREMVLAYKLEKIMSKDEIFAMYLNFAPMGRSTWGAAMGAESYFGKNISELTTAEAAFLASRPKGPAFYNPDRYAKRSIDRVLYVLEQLFKNKVIDQAEWDKSIAEANAMKFTAYREPFFEDAGHYLDEVSAQVKKTVGLDPRESSLKLESTLEPVIQLGSMQAMQEGLFQFEARTGRGKFKGAESNLQAAIDRINGVVPAVAADDDVWLTALKSYSPKMSDVAWPTAVVTSTAKGQITVGMRDGEKYTLKGGPKGALAQLKLYDVVYVVPTTTKKSRTADLRFAPEVQGAAVVVENSTGRIVSMVGGFSHGLSRYNRAVDMIRQPGSLAKPMTYLAALNLGMQPNMLINDASISLKLSVKGGHSWSPGNFDSSYSSEVVTMRKGLEESRNRVTARIAAGISPEDPAVGLDAVLASMKDCGFNDAPARFWPVILGSQETSLTKIASCYSAIATQGVKHQPHVLRSIARDGQKMWDESSLQPSLMTTADPTSIFQLRNMLQGVVERGTAQGLNKRLQDLVDASEGGSLSEYVGGKTGTSQGANDTWFAGFTQDLTFVVWVGYDNGSKESRRNLGDGTGGSVAAPIFADILRASARVYPLRRFDGPSDVQSQQLVSLAVASDGQLYNLTDLGRIGRGAVTDYIRLDSNGQIINTRLYLVGNDQPAPNYEEPVEQDPYQERQTNTRYQNQDPYADEQPQQQPTYTRQRQQNYEQDPYADNGNWGNRSMNGGNSRRYQQPRNNQYNDNNSNYDELDQENQ